MRERSSGRLASTALAALLACDVLLPLLGHKPLTEWDEGIYAEVAREMLHGDWLTPHWNGQLWMEKPPLMFWITAVFFRLFGVTEFWARAASALSGVGLVTLVHGWLFRRYGRRAAWIGSLMLLGTFGLLHACHTGEVDVLLALGCAIALCGLVRVEEESRHGWLLFFGGAAVALLTKGAAAVTLLPTLLLVALWNRWGWRRFDRSFWLTLPAFLAVVLAWPLFMAQRYGPAFTDEFLGRHVLTRASTQMEGHLTHWWFYLWVLLVSAAPFVLLYPASMALAFQRRELRVWAVFALVTAVLCSAAGTRLPHYIVPAYPALTIVTSVWLEEPLSAWLRRRSAGFAWIGSALTAVLLCTLTVLATAHGRSALHTARLTDGTVLPDSRESIELLKRLNAPASGIEGPLLYWREGRISSIATSVFYSRRQVQQVRLEGLPPEVLRNKYSLDPEPLALAVSSQPRLILLDHSLRSRVPPTMTYRVLETGPSLEIGIIAQRAPGADSSAR